MNRVIVDDGLLLDLLGGDRAVESSEVTTTGCWYYRLARAIHSPLITGRLSTALKSFDPARQAVILQSLDSLPSGIQILSWRHVVPIMRQLDPAFRLNLLSTEALATAIVLDASIRVATDNPSLAKAAGSLGVKYATIEI